MKNCLSRLDVLAKLKYNNEGEKKLCFMESNHFTLPLFHELWYKFWRVLKLLLTLKHHFSSPLFPLDNLNTLRVQMKVKKFDTWCLSNIQNMFRRTRKREEDLLNDETFLPPPPLPNIDLGCGKWMFDNSYYNLSFQPKLLFWV
jgi:hypothetical protein